MGSRPYRAGIARAGGGAVPGLAATQDAGAAAWFRIPALRR